MAFRNKFFGRIDTRFWTMQLFELLILSLLTCGFVVWSSLFIYHSSFLAIDGQRYFSLFDDAMISMRYAWNLSHGSGLVWNPGEYVEGYTNLLMVLLMSLVTGIFDDKGLAVLIIQLVGMVLMLGNAFLTMHIATALTSERRPSIRITLRLIAFFGTLAYYPLAYWSLMGMETGLLTFLLLFSLLMLLTYTEQKQNRTLILFSVSLGLAYLTRPDTLIPAMIMWAYMVCHIVYQRGKLKLTVLLFGLYLLFPAAQTLFRWYYYGELVPNTYTLKIIGIPLSNRIYNGLTFIEPFIRTNAIPLIIVAVGLLFHFRWKTFLLCLLIFSTLGYQIIVGGDPWPYWRMLSPVMPLLFVLLAYELMVGIDTLFCAIGVDRYRSYLPVIKMGWTEWLPPVSALALLLFFLLQTNRVFIRQIALVEKPYKVEAHQGSVNIAIVIQEFTTADAQIGVFEAGVIPYYTDRASIDFLGKVDPHVARLAPDLEQPDWFGMRGVVGHNKYDLTYSIKEKKPTYVQTFEWGQFFWGSQDISAWGKEAYTQISFKGRSFFFLNDSDAVFWEQIPDQDGER